MTPPPLGSLRSRLIKITSLVGAVAMLGGSPGASAGEHSVYDFKFKSIDGEDLSLEQFKGKALLIVNTASFCGFTNQYAGLQQVYETYKDRGLVVLGVPSNDFGDQEPGSTAEIKTFCETKFDISFPMTDKYVVTGGSAHPFYKWAASELGAMAKPRWNFHKYLISSDGKLVDWFSTVTGPTSSRVIAAIESSLPKHP
jgi:glutathione peroxidase